MLNIIKKKMKKSNKNINGMYHTCIKDRIYFEDENIKNIILPKILNFNDLAITDFIKKESYYMKNGVKTPNIIISYSIIHRCNINNIKSIEEICFTALNNELGTNTASKYWNMTETNIKDDTEIFLKDYFNKMMM